MAGGEDATYEAALDAISGDDHFKVLGRGPEPKNVALNRGIDAAQNDVLVLLDADSIVSSNWLTELVKPLSTGAAASYGFYLPSKWTWVSTEEYVQQIQYHDRKVPVFPGCASVAVRRAALERIGSLTVDAYSWEDWDVYARLIDSNERIVPAPQAQLVSERPLTLREAWANSLRAFRTHWAGLWYHRRIAIRRPLWAVNEAFFLVYGAVLCLLMLGGLVGAVVSPSLRPMVVRWGTLLVVWISGRRAALAAEAAAYTGEDKWLAWSWAPVALTFIRIFATLYSILTIWRQPRSDYKGPREQHNQVAREA